MKGDLDMRGSLMSRPRPAPALLRVTVASMLVIAALMIAPAGLSAASRAVPPPIARSASRASASTDPRLGPRGLVYEGSFRLPAPRSDHDTFEHGGTALAYDPGRDGLFVVGHDWYQLSAEVRIPAPARAASVSRLPRARLIQSFVDATGGKIAQAGPSTNKVGGQLVYSGRLYGSVYVYYDATDSQTASHWVRSSTSLRRGPVSGLFTVGRQGAGYVSGFMALVPAQWRAALGGPAIRGNCCVPIISRTSFGPAAFSFNPAALGERHPARDHALVYYPAAHPTLGAWDASFRPSRGVMYGGATTIRGVVFPNGTRTVLFFGTQGVGRFCYGEGTTDRSLAFTPTPDGTTWCYDPDNSSKGTHGYPYVPEVWAYDASALARVRAGRLRPWQVRPYATWRLSLPYDSPFIGGAAYDTARGQIYISQQYADGAAPVIDVLRVR